MNKINYTEEIQRIDLDLKKKELEYITRRDEERKNNEKEVMPNKAFQLLVIVSFMIMVLLIVYHIKEGRLYDQHLKLVYDVSLNCSMR